MIFDGEAVAGYSLPILDGMKVIPYVGWGTHYWNRQLTGQGSYDEQYLFFYLPVGVRFEDKFSESFSFAVDAAFHWNMGGTIQVLLSQSSPTEQNARQASAPPLDSR